MRNTAVFRGIFYALGLLTLALGLMINTKTGLGVSPIISVAYSTSVYLGSNFGNTTFVMYIIFVIVQMILHVIRWQQRKKIEPDELEHAGKMDLRLTLLADLLQIPLSMVFTRFLNLFSALLPELSERAFPVRILWLCMAIVLTGIGAAVSLNMRLIPNPGDGIVQAIADCIHKSVGFTKNCFDLLNICITLTISLVLIGEITGIGLGTVVAVIGVGRVIAVFNHFFQKPMGDLAGIEY